MDIDLKITLTNGREVKYISSDFPTVDACQEQILQAVDNDTNSLTINEPDGSRTVLSTRHIVTVNITRADG